MMLVLCKGGTGLGNRRGLSAACRGKRRDASWGLRIGADVGGQSGRGAAEAENGSAGVG